ncbi:uncharacterized protein LOC134785588 [Penaeus indicus]|uniref:uncharacterized protein LOC134785588 n=1 Tax=Penaeus indicus TaxID=29960 RepID=UPI00300D4292
MFCIELEKYIDFIIFIDTEKRLQPSNFEVSAVVICFQPQLTPDILRMIWSYLTVARLSIIISLKICRRWCRRILLTARRMTMVFLQRKTTTSLYEHRFFKIRNQVLGRKLIFSGSPHDVDDDDDDDGVSVRASFLPKSLNCNVFIAIHGFSEDNGLNSQLSLLSDWASYEKDKLWPESQDIEKNAFRAYYPLCYTTSTSHSSFKFRKPSLNLLFGLRRMKLQGTKSSLLFKSMSVGNIDGSGIA